MTVSSDFQPEDRIVIVGAGIGGLALALALLQRNIKVSVFERAPELGEVGAGVMLTPNATRVLDHLGVLSEVESNATCPGKTQVRHFQTGAALSTTDLGETFTERYGHPYYDVHRVHIHDALHRAVSRIDPHCIHVKHELVRIEEHEDNVTGKFTNGESIKTKVLIGCDGARSTVRQIIKKTDNPRYTGNLAWRGLMPITSLPEHQRGPEITIWVGPKRHFVEYTVKSGTLKNYVAISNSAEWEEEGWAVPSKVSHALDEFEEWHSDVKSIIAATPSEACFKWGLFDRDPLDSWSRSRITLLGDAAHPMLPFMAQGAAMALEDAVVLSRCLSSTLHLSDAFQSYEKVRQERTSWCQLQSRKAGLLFQHIATGKQLDDDRAERGRMLYEYDATSASI